MPYNPYFYVGTKQDTERDVLAFLSRKYFGKVAKLEIIEKEDLDLVCKFKKKNLIKCFKFLEKSLNWSKTTIY